MYKPESERVELGVAERWEKEATLSVPEFERKLAEVCLMEDFEYLRQRRAKADELGIPCGLLDEQRKRQRKEIESAAMQAHWNVEPWHEPVNGRELIGEVVKRIRRHVMMSESSLRTAAMWVTFAWMHDAAVHSPILVVSSPEAECGKTTLLALIGLMVPRGVIIVEVSTAVLFRMVEKWHPTLIVDEADSVFKNNPELRSIINSGWTRGTGVPRCHPDTHEPEFFETFGPKAIGLKGLNIPDTTLSRSIVIEMERKLPNDKVTDFAHTDDAELARLRSRLARFARDNVEKLKRVSPALPDGFGNRLAANWKLMLAIADLCGVSKEARSAAVALSRRNDEASLGVELLRDIRGIFAPMTHVDRIRSEALTDQLANMKDRPWAEMPWTGKPLTQPQLAKLLKGYGIKPKQIRFGDHTFKGYEFAWFDKAWRYIPPEPPLEAETPKQSQNCAKNAETSFDPVSGNVSANFAENRQCFAVSPDLGVRGGVPPGGDCLNTTNERDIHGYNLNQANKLSRTYATLLEALNRQRGKGQQKVTVEHVHVHQGGQAIVGHVEHKREGDVERKGGSTPCKGD
jgi:putative DNA primase/helicase